MKHPDLAALLHWLDDPTGVCAADREHLRAGCDQCERQLAILAGADALLGAAEADVAEADAAETALIDVDPLVKRVWRELSRWRTEEAVPANATRGVRGTRSGDDRRVYEGDGYDATVQIHGDAGSGGEIRGRLIVASTIRPAPTEVFLTCDTQPVATEAIDARGRFRVRGLPAGSYELRFFLDGCREIILAGLQVTREKNLE